MCASRWGAGAVHWPQNAAMVEMGLIIMALVMVICW
jgi:hypothetical protein